jgi:hypothetical protein
MTKNSVICNFINENPTTWEQQMDALEIKVRREGCYAIFNYGIMCDFKNPIVQEARGIIIDITTLTVVCWPFRKFGNYNEGYVDEIDWDSARVLEKVDGSIVKLWYDYSQEKWQFSTNGVVYSEKAPVNGLVGITYGDVIKQTENYKDIDYSILNKDYTYIFELVSPLTQIIVKYEKPMLYHLGTRNNKTGEEYNIDIGIIKPMEYSLCCLGDCINSVIALNKDNSQIDKEGYVVVDKDFHRIKVKSPDYIMMHHVSTKEYVTKKECIDVLLNQREKLDTIIKNCPTFVPVIKYYDYKLSELIVTADKMAILAVSLYKEYSYDRKAVADVIKSHPLSDVGFKSLTSDKTGSEILLSMPIEKLCKLIKDYEMEDLSTLFTKK